MSVYTPILDDGINVMGSGPDPQPVEPTLTSASTVSGPPAGGNNTILTGSGFTESGLVIMFGDNPGEAVTVLSDTEVRVRVPQADYPPGLGTVDITVTTDGGTASLPDGYTYTTPGPVVSSLTPSSGAEAGGYEVRIQGSGFNVGDAFDLEPEVTVDGVAVTLIGFINSNIYFRIPAGTGAVPVEVTTFTGSASSTFTYEAPEAGD